MKLTRSNALSMCQGIAVCTDVGFGSQDVMRYGLEKVGYNHGTYGWNWDFYLGDSSYGRVGVFVGYRNFPHTGVRSSRIRSCRNSNELYTLAAETSRHS